MLPDSVSTDGNLSGISDDLALVTCQAIRDAISARVDGEDPGMAMRVIEAHLRSCDNCRQFQAAADTRWIGGVSSASQLPDLSRRVPKLVALADRASTSSAIRAVLAVVAVQIIVFSVPNLAAPDSSGANAHDARHLGAFTIAYAVALLVVVIRPARARTVIPVACVLAGALVITAIVDLVNGNVPFINETLHLPEIMSVGLIWALATPTGHRPRAHDQPAPPRLTVVDDNQRKAG